jgi:hypothetical protein
MGATFKLFSFANSLWRADHLSVASTVAQRDANAWLPPSLHPPTVIYIRTIDHFFDLWVCFLDLEEL